VDSGDVMVLHRKKRGNRTINGIGKGNLGSAKGDRKLTKQLRYREMTVAECTGDWD